MRKKRLKAVSKLRRKNGVRHLKVRKGSPYLTTWGGKKEGQGSPTTVCPVLVICLDKTQASWLVCALSANAALYVKELRPEVKSQITTVAGITGKVR